MGKGPGLYSEIGKKARGFFFKFFSFFFWLWFLVVFDGLFCGFLCFWCCLVVLICRSSEQGLPERSEVQHHHLHCHWRGAFSPSSSFHQSVLGRWCLGFLGLYWFRARRGVFCSWNLVVVGSIEYCCCWLCRHCNRLVVIVCGFRVMLTCIHELRMR